MPRARTSPEMKVANKKAPKKISKETTKKLADKLAKQASFETTSNDTSKTNDSSSEPVKQFFFARHGLSHFNRRATAIEA